MRAPAPRGLCEVLLFSTTSLPDGEESKAGCQPKGGQKGGSPGQPGEFGWQPKGWFN